MFKSIGLSMAAFAALTAAPASAVTAIRYEFSVNYEDFEGGYDPISGEGYYSDTFLSGPAYVTVFPSAPNLGIDATYVSSGKAGISFQVDHGCGGGDEGDGNECFTVNIAFRGLTDDLPRSLDDVVSIQFDHYIYGHEDTYRLNGGGPAVSVSTIDVPGDAPGQDSGNFLDLDTPGPPDWTPLPPVLEPATWMMAILGLGTMGLQLRCRRKTARKYVMAINGDYPAPTPSIQ
jgi:hypothetical protein